MVDIVNNNELYNVFNKGYRMHVASNDSFDTISFVLITQILIPLTLSIITEIDIPSDHLSIYLKLKLKNIRESERGIIIKLYHKADCNNINNKIKSIYIYKLQPIFRLLKNKSIIHEQEILEYTAEKLQNIIYTVSETYIPKTNIKTKNSGLS